MTQNQFITVREAAQALSISEKKIMDLIDQKKLQAYRIAEKFLRLKKTEVLSLKSSGNIVKENIEYAYTAAERLRDFFFYNNFYILSFIVICALLIFIFYI